MLLSHHMSHYNDCSWIYQTDLHTVIYNLVLCLLSVCIEEKLKNKGGGGERNKTTFYLMYAKATANQNTISTLRTLLSF